MKSGKVNLVFILSIFCILISGLSICKAKKVAKAENNEDSIIQWSMTPTLSSNDLDIIQAISNSSNYIGTTSNPQGLLVSEIEETFYYLYNINGSVAGSTRGFNINFYTETPQGNRNYYSVNYTIQNNEYQYSNQSITGTGTLTIEKMFNNYWEYTEYGKTYLLNNSYWLALENTIYKIIETEIRIDTPEVSLNNYTLVWDSIENAQYYNVFYNGDLIGQTYNTMWVTSANGYYTVQACTSEEGYANSYLSESINQTNYNDVIGNGWNFYTLIGAVLDSEIILFKSLLNYEIFGINLFIALQIILTLCLVIIIIKKFVVKG